MQCRWRSEVRSGLWALLNVVHASTSLQATPHVWIQAGLWNNLWADTFIHDVMFSHLTTRPSNPSVILHYFVKLLILARSFQTILLYCICLYMSFNFCWSGLWVWVKLCRHPPVPKWHLSCLDSRWLLKHQVMCRCVHPWNYVSIWQQGLQIRQ